MSKRKRSPRAPLKKDATAKFWGHVESIGAELAQAGKERDWHKTIALYKKLRGLALVMLSKRRA